MVYEYGELWWNDIGRGKPKNSKKNPLQCHFVHHNPTWTDPGMNPGLCGQRPAAKHLSHGTTYVGFICTENVQHCMPLCLFYVKLVSVINDFVRDRFFAW
jgi:hypothetical protein